MGLFKSKAEKGKIGWEKIKDRWEETSEYKLGLSYEEGFNLRKEFEKGLIDSTNNKGLIVDYTPINSLFPDLTSKQKCLILYYGRWIEEINMKKI